MASGERTIKIKFDGTAAGLTRAVASAKAALKALEVQAAKNKQGMKTLDGLASRALAAGANMARLAMTMSTLASGVSIVAALGAAVSTAAGAFPLLVAGGLAAAGVMATMKLGADGIKKGFEGLTPALDTLKAKVSESFASTLVYASKNLQGLLPKLTSGFQQIASALGGVATRFTAMLAAPKQVAGLNTILSGTSQIVQNIGKFLAPVGAAFIRIGAVAMPMLVQLTGGLGNLGERFNAFVQGAADDGRLQAWIQSAIDLFRMIGSAVGTAFGIVKDVFSGLMSSGLGQLGGTLTVVLDTIRDFTSSEDGQAAIRAIGDALGAVSQAVGAVLNSGLKAIGPIIPPLATAFAALATTIGGILKAAIDWLGPALLGIATFIQQNTTWLVPLVTAVLAFAAVIKIITIVTAAWEAVQLLLNIALIANPIGIVIMAIAALIAVIILIINNLDFFRGIWDAVWKWASDIITDVVTWFHDRWNDVMGWFKGIWDAVSQWWNTLWLKIGAFVGVCVGIVKQWWSGAVDNIKGFFRGLGDFVSGIWSGIVSGAKSAVNTAIRLVNGIIHGVNNVSGLVGIPAIPDIPMLARGGTASAGRSYLVGERGPELFTPGRTGRVTNAGTTADAMGGGFPSTIELNIDLGKGIQQRVTVELDEFGRQTRRAALAGAR
jgi:phage-related protein